LARTLFKHLDRRALIVGDHFFQQISRVACDRFLRR